MDAIREIAVRQHGLFTTTQWLAEGLTRRQLNHAATRRIVVPVHRGVFRVGGAPVSWEHDVLAACLAVGGCASHGCAGRLWKFRGFEGKRIEVVVNRRHTPVLPGIRVRRSSELNGTRLGRIPITSRARTLLDLAACAPERVEGALNGVVLQHRAELVRIDRLLRRLAHYPGQPRLRRLVDEMLAGRAPTESVLEDDLLAVLRAAGLPEPVPQFPVGDYRIDFAYPGDVVGIEAHGLVGHAEKADLQRNCTKSNALRDWRMLYFTWDDVHRRPGDVAAEVAAALGRRRARAS